MSKSVDVEYAADRSTRMKMQGQALCFDVAASVVEASTPVTVLRWLLKRKWHLSWH